MEDSAKALMIAAGVLIAIMIITFGLALYSSLTQYIDDTQNRIDENELQRFNEQFTKYINCGNEPNAPTTFTLTIQDIVTVANIAYENNKKYDLTEEDYKKDKNNYYVKVCMPGCANLEVRINEKKQENNTTAFDAASLLKSHNEETYKCTSNDIQINPTTGRVCFIEFKEQN